MFHTRTITRQCMHASRVSLKSITTNNVRLCSVQRLRYNYRSNNSVKPHHASSILLAAALTLSSFTYSLSCNAIQAERDPHPEWQAGDRQPSLPTFTRKQVKEHNTESSLWLTYRYGVYDLTAFCDEHPGSVERLLLACNGNHDISTWWQQLGYHNVNDVHQLLETFRIANISESDSIECAVKDNEVDPVLRKSRTDLSDTAFSYEPFIAETPIDILHKYDYIPSKYHYVRNHYPVPTHLDWDDKFTISGIGIPNNQIIEDDDDEIEEGYSLKYSDILSLPSITRDVYLQCGGHRRVEFKAYGSTKGSKWNVGAIGNGQYKGVLLRDVMKHIGVDVDALYNNGNNDLFVWFFGADCAPDGEPYASCIPLYKALDPRGDVMLAYEYNGEALMYDHGFPVRMLVPGWVGARSVKWIEQIIIAEKECTLGSYTKSYKITRDMKREIRGLPVNSAIHAPQTGQCVKINEDNILHIAGEAHSGDGSAIVRVDVSIDGGNTWNEAKLLTAREVHKNNWNWTKWECDVDVTPYESKENAQLELVCRAVDLDYNRQPESCKADLTFNPKGYGANSYHRINVSLSFE